MSFVTYEQDGYVGVITINRPEALNALNVQVLKDLDAVIDNINLDETRAVIVTGAGEKAVVAGDHPGLWRDPAPCESRWDRKGKRNGIHRPEHQSR